MGEFSVGCFVKQKTAYEMRISDWSSDVCSSDLRRAATVRYRAVRRTEPRAARHNPPPHSSARPPAAARARPRRPRSARSTRLSCPRCRLAIGRSHVLTPVTYAPLVFLLLLENIIIFYLFFFFFLFFFFLLY